MEQDATQETRFAMGTTFALSNGCYRGGKN